MKITLKDGSVKEYAESKSVYEIARDLSEGLARMTVAGEVDGEVVDLRTVIDKDCNLNILTLKDEKALSVLRHTASHVMAQAVKRLYPTVKLAIGPSVADGFYYDMDFETPLTSDDFEKIEAEMKKIIKENLEIVRFTKPREEAIAFMKEKGEPYKVELIEDLPEDAEISFYQQGEFVDLCAGPHLKSTKDVGKAFKIMSLAGAYWRGDEHNKMLTRLYATAFPKKEELEAYITMMEEAKKRDHRKLGKELGLFMMHEAGPGFPFFLPKGMTLKNTLIDYWREIHKKAGYVEVSTPIILNRSLWETSGHWDHYKNNMYTTVIDGEDYAIKPMNCPGGVLVYAAEPRSYRDLPLRVGELGLVHRHEKSGQLHGLMRVRCFTQDDAHIFMTPEQIKDEIKGVVALINDTYSMFGFKYHVELSTRPEDSMGSDEDWEMATAGLRDALDELGMPYVVNEGDGAFYGPKIDFHLVGFSPLNHYIYSAFRVLVLKKLRIGYADLMVIPYALGSDQRQVEFLVQCGNRYVEGIGLLRFCTIAEIYGLYGRLQKLCAVLLGILCQTFIQIHNVLGRHNHMNGHLSVLYGQSSLSLVKFIYMEHTAVCIEICGVNAVLQCRCCNFF